MLGWLRLGLPNLIYAVGHDLRYDVAHDRLVLFANTDVGGGGEFDQTWLWDGVGWSEAEAGGEVPWVARSAAGAYDRVRETLVTHGGFFRPSSGPVRCHCDVPPDVTGTITWRDLESKTQLWDGTGWSSWLDHSGAGDGESFALAWHPGSEKTVRFGGFNAFDKDCPEDCGGFTSEQFYLDGTATWDGSFVEDQCPDEPPGTMCTFANWVPETPAHSPGVVGDGSDPLVLGALNGGDRMETFGDDVILFRGAVGPPSSVHTETWLWDGTDWTQLFPTHSPSVRIQYASAYDPDLGVVVYGGRHPYVSPPVGVLHDTWVWDGTDWMQPTLALGHDQAGGLFGAAMEYDESRGRLVLHGGTAFASDSGLPDTWVLADFGGYHLESRSLLVIDPP